MNLKKKVELEMSPYTKVRKKKLTNIVFPYYESQSFSIKEHLLAKCSKQAGYAEKVTLGQFFATEMENLKCRVASCKQFTPRSTPGSQVNRVRDAEVMCAPLLDVDLSTNSGVYSMEAQT